MVAFTITNYTTVHIESATAIAQAKNGASLFQATISNCSRRISIR